MPLSINSMPAPVPACRRLESFLLPAAIVNCATRAAAGHHNTGAKPTGLQRGRQLIADKPIAAAMLSEHADCARFVAGGMMRGRCRLVGRAGIPTRSGR
jgi:hypothetical protein